MRDIDPQAICLDTTPSPWQSLITTTVINHIQGKLGLACRVYESRFVKDGLGPYRLSMYEEMGLIPADLILRLIGAAHEKTHEAVQMLTGGGITALAFIKYLHEQERLTSKQQDNLSDMVLIHMNRHPQPVQSCTLLLSPSLVHSGYPPMSHGLPPDAPQTDRIAQLNACFNSALAQNRPPNHILMDLTDPSSTVEHFGQTLDQINGLFARSLITSLGK